LISTPPSYVQQILDQNRLATDLGRAAYRPDLDLDGEPSRSLDGVLVVRDWDSSSALVDNRSQQAAARKTRRRKDRDQP
jgi:hypothetical protein